MTQVITGNRVANNSITYDNLSANVKSYFVPVVYDLDDVSYMADGFTSVFPLQYNTSNVSVASPWNLLVTVAGLVQPAYANTNGYEPVWSSYTLTACKGYTLDDTGSLKFADVVPEGSDIMIRITPGIPNTNPKVYPFKPTDIMMGY